MNSADSDDYAAALRFLYSRLNFERSAAPSYRSPAFRLQRMRDLLARLDDPHLAAPTIHVAGTKGKGSTCVMFSSALQAHQRRVGLYTSPHLTRLEERFQIDQRPCSPNQLVSLVEAIREPVDALDRQASSQQQHGPTFFEITTAMAMLHFAREAVDWNVLETGLGGRLDSTNACSPALCVITSISLDHTRQLGDTVEQIAAEKAGIIKPGAPVVSGVLEAGPAAQIAAAARRAQTSLEVLQSDFQIQSEAADPDNPFAGRIAQYRDADGALANVRIGMPGEHQARNAALAIRGLRRLQADGTIVLEESRLRDALAGASCRGRLELIETAPLTLVDVAHNEASIQALLATLGPVLLRRRPAVLVFAASRDKDSVTMLRALLPRFDAVVFTTFRDNPRSMQLGDLQAAGQAALAACSLPQPPPIRSEAEAEVAVELARRTAGADGLVCITGSFFLAAQILGN